MHKFLLGIKVQIYFSPSCNAVPGNLEQDYLAMMPPLVRQAISRYERWQDRQATLFGKMLLLMALRKQFHNEGGKKFHSLDVTPDGKPFIPGGPEFNISHSDGIIVLAVAQCCNVGIDIEKIRQVNIDDFSSYLPEVANLRETNDPDNVSRIFFDCWTSREAVMKGCGKGLLAPMEHVVLKNDNALLYETKWFIKKVPIDDGYCCHVATDKPTGNIALEQVNLTDGKGYFRQE